MGELFLELYSEEIPARMQARAAADLAQMLTKALEDNGLAPGKVRSFFTPMRLVVVCDGVPERQADVTIEKRGPRADAPQKAIDGFLGALGVSEYHLDERDDKKGKVLFASYVQPGRPTVEVAGALIEDILQRFPWPKAMRWGAHQVRWVRPLRSICCLFDGEVVPVRFGPIESGATVRGHRFLAPQAFAVKGFARYQAGLREAYVMLDAGERRALIKKQARALAAEQGGELAEDDRLLDELAGLVEWPVPLLGAIDAKFMDLPQEVLITSMREHQRYLVVRKADGSLAPCFITVANIAADDGGAAIRAGNERVLRARLWDADFFWNQDRKQKLEARRPKLSSVVFHARLGDLGARVTRLERLAEALCAFVPNADAAPARRAAALCKCDLVTGMVGEFPELQGITGRYYAAHDGEPADVGAAIAEHYAPQGPYDACPSAPASVVLALAEKLDTLVGFFAIDEKPTGSKDPFALRRAALGVIRLVLENDLRLPLDQAFALALAGYDERFDDVTQERVRGELLDFFADRLRVHLRGEGVRHDLVAAAFAASRDDDFLRLQRKVDALSRFMASDDGINLLTATKRASNILRIEEKKDGRAYDAAPVPDQLVEPAEQALFERLDAVGAEIDRAVAEEDYAAAMAAFAALRMPVDAFFESVRVNDEDATRRANRLCLLHRLRGALGDIADFSLIEDGATV